MRLYLRKGGPYPLQNVPRKKNPFTKRKAHKTAHKTDNKDISKKTNHNP